MKKIILFIILLPIVLTAQEKVTLTTPEAVPSNLAYRVDSLTIKNNDPASLNDDGQITIQLIGVERAVSVTCTYTSQTIPSGTLLLNGLNKANLSTAYNNNATTGSLIQRIFHRLVVMGESTTICGKTLTGSLTGSPQ